MASVHTCNRTCTICGSLGYKQFENAKRCNRSRDNPVIGGASLHNSMPMPSPVKWRGKPENPA